jgi:hypothetical protein
MLVNFGHDFRAAIRAIERLPGYTTGHGPAGAGTSSESAGSSVPTEDSSRRIARW